MVAVWLPLPKVEVFPQPGDGVAARTTRNNAKSNNAAEMKGDVTRHEVKREKWRELATSALLLFNAKLPS